MINGVQSENDEPRTRTRTRQSLDSEAQRVAMRSNEVSGPDDHDVHLDFRFGQSITPRYTVAGKMGEGTYGQVVKCWDSEREIYVAIKVARRDRRFREAALAEIKSLGLLSTKEIGRVRCVNLRRWFAHQDRICIVLEKLGPSLLELLMRNSYKPYPLDLIREFGQQLLESVACMHDLSLIHTDLKPDNVLLVSNECVTTKKRDSRGQTEFTLPKYRAIKLIDFGNTVYGDKTRHSVVSTRHYRAPEVILGIGWTYPCDIWSIGCILVELCTGSLLFQTHENLEHLAMMERILGPLPTYIVQHANLVSHTYFKRGPQLNWPEGAVSNESREVVTRLCSLKDLVLKHVVSSRSSSFIDLLHGLLKYDPSERLTAWQALDHCFFKDPIRV